MITYNHEIAVQQQRIQVKEFQLWNKSNLKLRLAFLNKKIINNKKEYYKLVIWLKSDELTKLNGFNFGIQIKTPGGLVPLELTKFNSSFLADDFYYLEAHIDAKNFDQKMMLAYDFVHDNLEGRGIINIDLTIRNNEDIDNELIVFDNNQVYCLFDRKIIAHIPEFLSAQRYFSLATFEIKTIDLQSWKFSYLNPINDMILIVKNDIWSNAISINDFKISLDGLITKNYYDFKPKPMIVENNTQFDLKLNNFLTFNKTTGLIEEGGELKGMLFNPTITTPQQIQFSLNIFGEEWKFNNVVYASSINYEYFIDETKYLYKSAYLDEI